MVGEIGAVEGGMRAVFRKPSPLEPGLTARATSHSLLDSPLPGAVEAKAECFRVPAVVDPGGLGGHQVCRRGPGRRQSRALD